MTKDQGSSERHSEQGTNENEAEHIDWEIAERLLKMAKLGDPDSQFLLGHMLRDGNGLKLDRTEGASWWRQAAKLGHAGALYALGNMHGNVDGVGVESPSDPSLAIRLAQGIEIDSAEVEVAEHGLLTYKGAQVLLYIKDSRKDRETLLHNPEGSPRFHVAECHALLGMRKRQRFERYVVTTSTSGIFKVDAKDPDTDKREAMEVRLLVCRHCLIHLDFKDYKSGSKRDKNTVCHSFNIQDFFSEYESVFKSKPKYTDESAPTDGYTHDWKEKSRKFRAGKNWKCDACEVDLSKHKNLLHSHHINGVTFDNACENLKALCLLCHSREPSHNNMQVPPAKQQIIVSLWREQGL